ncbi:putative integral membrane protein [Acanthocheilonema viteae]
MALAVSEIATEIMPTVSDEKLQSSTVNYILYTYAYVVIGILLILINIPTFMVVVNDKALRSSYLVLAVIFLNSGFMGISSILLGVKRLIDTVDGERCIDHHKCVLNVPLLLFTSEFMSGWSLLMNSVERFSVVAFPIYYYTHSTRINYSIIAAQYTITVIAVTTAVTASMIEPARSISNMCINFGAKFLSNNSHSRDLSQFLKNQKRYTRTAIISCCFTFFLVVVSAKMERLFEMDPSLTSQIIMMCCVYLRLLNSFNMATLFLYRQKDVQRATIRYLKYICAKQKQSAEPVATVNFVK